MLTCPNNENSILLFVDLILIYDSQYQLLITNHCLDFDLAPGLVLLENGVAVYGDIISGSAVFDDDYAEYLFMMKGKTIIWPERDPTDINGIKQIVHDLDLIHRC